MHAVQLDASTVRGWCRAAADDLYRVREAVDALNVFPIADADTGTNLHLTMTAAADAAPAHDETAERAWAAVARAAMLGAHGNSGVILSQLLRGIAEHAPIDGASLAAALRHAATVAYAAVGDPVEGTMLTASAAAAAAAEAAQPADIAAVAAAAADGAWAALARTPDQLTMLADAGVVDAGAAGLVVVLDALARACAGSPDGGGREPRVPAPRRGTPVVVARAAGPAYEVMYLLDADPESVTALRGRLAGLGDSLVVVGGDDVWNVHVHVDDAGAAVEAGMAAGRPYRVRVTHLLGDPTAGRGTEPTASTRTVLAVAPTDGLGRLFETSGAVAVARPADGSAPLAAALFEARPRSAGAEVVLLPDDASAFAPAADAAGLLRAAGVRAAVVPSRAVVQSLAALAVHRPEQPFDDDVVAMTAAAVVTGHAAVPVDGDHAADSDDAAAHIVTELGRLLAGREGALVTLVGGPDLPAGLVDAVVERMRQVSPGTETVVYGDGPSGPVVLVGVE